MSERNQNEAALRLAEAIREIAGQGDEKTADANPSIAVKPTTINIFFLLLLIVNVTFLVFLIPRHLLEGPNWDLVKEVVPAVAGSFLVVLASWYKEWIDHVFQTVAFRVSQGALAVILLFSLWIPWLRIKPIVIPLTSAMIFVDAAMDEKDKNDNLWQNPTHLDLLSLKRHQFLVHWNGESKKNDREFVLTPHEILLAALGFNKPRWAHLYKVEFSNVPSDVAQVRIEPDSSTPIDRDFLDHHLAQYSLQSGPHESLILYLKKEASTWGDETFLPAGTYRFSSMAKGIELRTSKPIQILADTEVNLGT
jgi:hypothetical protein